MFIPLRYFMIATALSGIIFGIIFLVIAAQTQKSYLRLWGFALISYALMFVVDFRHIEVPALNGLHESMYILYRQPFTILGGIFLYAGTYSFFDLRTPAEYRITLIAIAPVFLLCGYFDAVYQFLGIPIVLYSAFILVRTGLKFFANTGDKSIPEKYAACLVILFWSIYCNNMLFTKGYIPLMLLNYFLSLCLLNGIAMLLITIHFKKSELLIAQKESHYRVLVENASDLIFLYNYNTKEFEYVSPSIAAIVGLPTVEIGKNPSAILERMDKEGAEKLQSLLNHPSEKSSNFIFTLEDQSSVADGKPVSRWYELYSSPVTDSSANVAGVECIIRDVTSRVEVEQNLRKSEQARKELIEDISHELRTPITLIQGYSESMLNRVIPKTSHNAYLGMIHSKTLLLNSLLEDLIQASDVTSQSMEYRFYEVNAMHFFNKMLAQSIVHIESRHRSPVCRNFVGEHFVCVVDEQRIEEVFSNLISNAVKYTREGEEIAISCRVEGEEISEYQDTDLLSGLPTSRIVVEVADRGRGISQHELPHLFKRKYKGSGGGYPGQGLGLYISNEIIRQHSGTIWAANRENQGAVFTFAIPCYTREMMREEGWEP